MDNPNSANPPHSVGFNLRPMQIIIIAPIVAFPLAAMLWVGAPG
jgi:hypothetical protein